MKGIVTLVLMMLIGGYGAAHSQTPMEMETATETETKAQDFLGLKWGAGIGVFGGFGGDPAVEKASLDANKIVRVDEEGDMRPQLFLEMHTFLWGGKVIKWREYQRKKASYEMEMTRLKARKRQADLEQKPAISNSTEAAMQALQWPTMPEQLPEVGFGPFIALQSSGDNAIDALALGVMYGFRKIPSDSLSVNFGLGLSLDPSVQVLGDGVKRGKLLLGNETEVRLKKESRFGWALMISFTF